MVINIKDEYSLDYKILKSKIIYNTYAYYEIMKEFEYPTFIHETAWTDGYSLIYNKENIPFKERINIINDLVFLISEEKTNGLFSEKINYYGKEMYGICLSKKVLTNLLEKDGFTINDLNEKEPEILKKLVRER